MRRPPVSVVLVLVFLASAVQAALLCQTRSGTAKVRDTCRPRETQLDPVALGLEGPQGMPGPGLVVKDVNGALLDPASLEQLVTVVRRVGDATIYFLATSEGILEARPGGVRIVPLHGRAVVPNGRTLSKVANWGGHENSRLALYRHRHQR